MVYLVINDVEDPQDLCIVALIYVFQNDEATGTLPMLLWYNELKQHGAFYLLARPLITQVSVGFREIFNQRYLRLRESASVTDNESKQKQEAGYLCASVINTGFK